ncbi:hypothetical protein B6D60_04825 [candidate division KSB1 bacterium 4484_87]|nr:MAG: hypothetical protein B6D60_04825 [candidate division KSB1 bacterium 4484_87]
MKIISVEKNSLAEQIGVLAGDEMIAINGEPIRDPIDYRFHVSDEYLEIELQRQGETVILEIEKDYDDDLGVIFEEIQYRHCGNKCIFCFIDQNPPGLRDALYFKDEDYRLSFIYGNYVTLTNVGRKDLQRIAEQRLSPLYVSVHATDLETRKLMLGIRGDDKLLEKIEFLTDNGIELHTQIVLCPGINDREILDRTIDDLAKFFPAVQSIAIVPLGLTRHRQELYPLQPMTPDFAAQVIEQLEPKSKLFKEKLGQYLIYLADEFYLQAKKPLPSAERYDEFPQIENGVGMTREFLDSFQEQIASFPHRIKQPIRLVMVTAKSAEPVMRQEIYPALARIANLSVEIVPVTNRFYGDSVTVTGLLTGQDIFNQLKLIDPADLVLLPGNCVNFEGVFLDEWTPEQLSKELNQRALVFDDDWNSLLQNLNE